MSLSVAFLRYHSSL